MYKREPYKSTTCYCCTIHLNGRKPETSHPSSMFKRCTGFSSSTRWNTGGRCGFQVVDLRVAWIWSSVGPTIHRDRGYPNDIVRLWSPMFLDYLLSPVVTYCPVTSNHCWKECEARASHRRSLLSIIVDGRSRGIVRTDPIPKPDVSSTLPSKRREML